MIRAAVETWQLMWRHRPLIAVLVRRELAARYRASVLGFLWSMVNPLLLLAVYTVVFTTVFEPRMEGADPYSLFLFAGLLPWLFFSGVLLDAAVTLVDNGPLLAKVVCPPEIFPAVTVAAHTVHHLLALPVLLLALGGAAALGLHPFPWTVVLLPLALVPWLVLAIGLALAVSVLGVLFRDVRDLVANLLNILFFGSPIIYTLEGLESATLRSILRLNPLAVEVEVYRALAFEGRIPSLTEWALALAVALVAWAFGAALFSRLRDTVAETL